MPEPLESDDDFTFERLQSAEAPIDWAINRNQKPSALAGAVFTVRERR